MKRTWIMGSLLVAAVAACGGNRGDNAGDGAAGSGTETGTMQGGAVDTGTSGGGGGGVGDTAPVMSDSATSPGATGGTSADTARRTGTSSKGNQTESGVTDAKTGKSTLGKGVTTTRPDQGEAVTSKGDTVRRANDSTAVGQQ
jgi:hypothetical protein